MRSTVCLWKIQPSDREKTLTLLEYCLLPATREQAKYWINRSLSHYNRRDVSKDAVIIIDLSYDMIEKKASLVAIVEVLRDFRHKSTKDNPWWPTDGDILSEVQSKMKIFNERYEILKSDRLQISREASKEFTPPTDEEKKRVADIVRNMGKEKKVEND